MDLTTALELLQIDASEAHPSEDEVRAAYKMQALVWHPDKNADRVEEATERFQRLGEAQELLLQVDNALSPDSVAAARSVAGPTAVSLGLRNLAGPQLSPTELAGTEFTVAWRCGGCAEPGTICCRLNAKKHSCLCGHKLMEHVPGKHGLRCSAKECACRCFDFHVQHGGWQARCGCKHKHTDHSAVAPHACTKPSCGCASYDVRWICSCGHPWCAASSVSSIRFSSIADSKQKSGIRSHEPLGTCGGSSLDRVGETAVEAEAKRAKWADRGHAPAGASATAHRQAASARQFGGDRREKGERPRRRALEGKAASIPKPTDEDRGHEQDASGDTDPSARSSETAHLQRRIRAIYAAIPEKTPEEVDAILSRFNGRERELLDKMASKYQLPSTEPAAVERE